MANNIQDIKGEYLEKFHIKEGSLNSISVAKNNSLLVIHANLVNTLLQSALSDFQISFFEALLEDISVFLKIKNHMARSSDENEKAEMLGDMDTIKKDIDFFISTLKIADINSIKFADTNESVFLSFYSSLMKSYQFAYADLGYSFYAGLPSYEELVKEFLSAYLRAINAFYISLYQKAIAIQNESNNNTVPSQEEDDIFYMETRNFFVRVLDFFSSLNYNLVNINNHQYIEYIYLLIKLLNKLALVYTEEISLEEASDLAILVKENNLSALIPFDSYYRKWIYNYVNNFEENVSRS